MSSSHGSLTQTALNGANGIHVPRYLATNNDYNLHTSNNGPRSLSDSSQAESPVQDDLLTTNTPNLGNGNGNANASNLAASNTNSAVGNNHNFIGVNQSQNSYGGSSSNTGPSSGCNSSLYPVLPASLLYSQLYTAANQTHSFHSHAAQNSMVHGELQSVMEHITTASGRQQQNLMIGGTDLTHIGNCGSSARAGEDVVNNAARQMSIQRAPHHHTDNGNSVWRPY